MKGTLYGIGVGPGDPDLMTLKAVKTIQNCDTIAVPNTGSSDQVAWRIAKQAVPEIEDKSILELLMPMTRDQELLKQSHQDAAKQIAHLLDQGINVAFLTLGDPTIYSTYIYVHQIVKDLGYQTIIVPGVPSFCAVAAELGDSLTEASEPLHVIPGSYDCLEDNLALDGTKILMKSGKSLSKVVETVRKNDQMDYAKMVQNCGFENQKVYHDLSVSEYDPDYFSIVVIKNKKNQAEA